MKAPKASHRQTILRVLALLAVILISVYVYTIRDDADRLAVYGYPGIFLLSLLSYATVLLPAPGVAVVFTMGGIFHPIGVALAAGTGAALGEISGYLAGFSGQAVIERTAIYSRMTGWIQKYGFLAVVVLAAIPNPFFDLAGVAAGALKMPLRQFLIWIWIGETIKMLIFAYAGASSFQFLQGLGL